MPRIIAIDPANATGNDRQPLDAVQATPAARLHEQTLRSILQGGSIAGVLDAVNGVVAFGLVLGMNPIQVLQYIASGVLGVGAFQGGLATAALGALLHFAIAFVVAGVYVAVSRRLTALTKHPFVYGASYGVAVYVFMNYVVLPFSAVPRSGFSIALLLNGLIGHALLVGLPIAWAARRNLESSDSRAAEISPAVATLEPVPAEIL
jgi:hypothetical protein